ETIVFDSPETVETYRYLADLAQFSPPGSENFDWGATELLIKSGKCANVMYNGAWIRELAEDNPELLAKYAMAPMPIPEGGQPAHTGYPRALVVTRAAEQNLENVQEFLRFLYQPENHASLLMMEPGLFMPVTKATATSDAFLEAPVIAENRELVSVQASIADSVSIIGFTGETPAPSASQLESSFTLGKVLQQIVLEGLSPEDAVAWGAQQYRDIIR
ncbi:MAG TPA: ABC transporter substrate-binding protein, partial [Trueperaceae bacterium]|nr:ABC transporter substrate-binding protein [Trueperaceae bacterium]